MVDSIAPVGDELQSQLGRLVAAKWGLVSELAQLQSDLQERRVKRAEGQTEALTSNRGLTVETQVTPGKPWQLSFTLRAPENTPDAVGNLPRIYINMGRNEEGRPTEGLRALITTRLLKSTPGAFDRSNWREWAANEVDRINAMPGATGRTVALNPPDSTQDNRSTELATSMIAWREEDLSFSDFDDQVAEHVQRHIALIDSVVDRVREVAREAAAGQ